MPSGVYKRTEEHNQKLSKSKIGKRNPQFGKRGNQAQGWKGEKVGYQGIHIWLRKLFGKPFKCEHCKTIKAKKFEWALIKGKKYERKRENFIRLCGSCHEIYDDCFSKRKRDALGRFI